MNFLKLIGITLILLLTGCGNSPEGKAQTFVNYIKHGQHLEMQDSLSSESRQMMLLFYGSITDKALKPYYRTGQMSNFSLQKLSETDQSSRFSIQINSNDGSVYTDIIDLIKEDGKWKVSNF